MVLTLISKSLPRPLSFIAMISLGIMFMSVQAADAARAAGEYDIKAAYIYNFAKFIQWPRDAFPDSRDMTLCIFGSNPFGNAFDAVKSEPVDDRTFQIRALNNLDGLEDCHILFVSKTDEDMLPKVLNAAKGLPALIVSEADSRFNDVVINFYIERDNVRFMINIDAAKRKRLKISSKLLSVARIVHDAK